MKPRIATVLGTRPEAIKLAPVLARLQSDPDIDSRVILTGQHREICDEVLHAFEIEVDDTLQIMRHGQCLNELAQRVIGGIDGALERHQPGLVLVQGDTTTAFAAAFAAFNRQIPVGHVEAGLRTGDNGRPWPEEANRKLISGIAAMHFAPTPLSRANLVGEGVRREQIWVTGNTVVDALERLRPAGTATCNADLARALRAERMVVVTSHRRESWGEPQRVVARALREVALRNPGVTFLVPLHPNPVVREALAPPLDGLRNVILTEPLAYRDMLTALSNAWVAVSDSGGIQEEATAIGTPVLLLRDVTERPEGVDAGVVKIVGTSGVRLATALQDMLDTTTARETASRAAGVFGDGYASLRIVAALRARFGLPAGEVGEFEPSGYEGGVPCQVRA